MHIHQRIALNNAGRSRIPHALLHRFDNAAWHLLFRNFTGELNATAIGCRLHRQGGLRKLDFAGNLALELIVYFRFTLDRLPIHHLWIADIDLQIELADEPLGQHFEMELPHTGEHGLPPLFIECHMQRWILAQQFF